MMEMEPAQLLDEEGGFVDQQQQVSVAAEVQIAIVSIKVLKIGKKQMTMGVFRQLQAEYAVDPLTAEPNGPIWGQVNYFWGDCDSNSQHLHLVWQKGAELRRGCFYPDASRALDYDADLLNGQARQAAAYALTTALRESTDVFVVGAAADNQQYKVTLKEDGSWWNLPERVHYEYEIHRSWRRPATREIECDDDGITKLSWLSRKTWMQAWELSFKLSSQSKELRQKQQELNVKWAKRWKEYRKLDQLFIAV